MDIFGDGWSGYWDNIREDWKSRVSEDDVVLIAGDVSWAMRLDEALPDIDEIAELPGKRGSIAFRNVLCLAAGEGSLRLPLPMDTVFWRLNNGPEFRPGTRASITSDGSTLTLKTDASAGGDYAGISYALKKKLRVD